MFYTNLIQLRQSLETISAFNPDRPVNMEMIDTYNDLISIARQRNISEIEVSQEVVQISAGSLLTHVKDLLIVAGHQIDSDGHYQ